MQPKLHTQLCRNTGFKQNERTWKDRVHQLNVDLKFKQIHPDDNQHTKEYCMPLHNYSCFTAPWWIVYFLTKRLNVCLESHRIISQLQMQYVLSVPAFLPNKEILNLKRLKNNSSHFCQRLSKFQTKHSIQCLLRFLHASELLFHTLLHSCLYEHMHGLRMKNWYDRTP